MPDDTIYQSVLAEQSAHILNAAQRVLDTANGPLEPSVAALIHAVAYGLRHITYSQANLRIDDAALTALHRRADALLPRLERITA